MLAEEVGLNLLEDAAKITVGTGQYTELPGGIGAPEENSLWNVFMADIVHTNCQEVVILNSYFK